MLKQLRYFQSVVRNGSFSEAAEENFISQSAICTDRPGALSAECF
ncbi:helix-turn-helix domain-containing protein [Fusicatenibacter sp.]